MLLANRKVTNNKRSFVQKNASSGTNFENFNPVYDFDYEDQVPKKSKLENSTENQGGLMLNIVSEFESFNCIFDV